MEVVIKLLSFNFLVTTAVKLWISAYLSVSQKGCWFPRQQSPPHNKKTTTIRSTGSDSAQVGIWKLLPRVYLFQCELIVWRWDVKWLFVRPGWFPILFLLHRVQTANVKGLMMGWKREIRRSMRSELRPSCVRGCREISFCHQILFPCHKSKIEHDRNGIHPSWRGAFFFETEQRSSTSPVRLSPCRKPHSNHPLSVKSTQPSNFLCHL